MSRKTISAERSFADLRKDTAYEAAYAMFGGEFRLAAAQISDPNPSIDGGWTAE